MSTNSRWWFLDLTLALVLTAVGGAASYMGIGGRLQVALVVPLVVFLPGYVLVSALFPEGGDNDERSFKPSENVSAYAIGGTVRVALAATLSVAIVPMIAALANFTPWGVRLHPILYGIVIFTAVTGVVAFVRRLRVPAENRYSPGLPGLLFSPADRSNGELTMALNVGIVISVLLLASSAGYAVLHPPQPEPFTEFHPQTNKIDGNTQTMYQSDLASDGVTVNIQNHEGETVQYTVVALLQRVEDGKVTDQAQFAKEQVTVDAGQKKQVTLTGDPALSGDNVRVQLYLYNGPASGQPDEQARVWPVSKSASSDQGDSSDQNQGSDNGQETTQQTTERQTTAQRTTQRQSTSTSSLTSSTSSTSTTGGTTTTNGGGISTTSSTTTTTADGGFF